MDTKRITLSNYYLNRYGNGRHDVNHYTGSVTLNSTPIRVTHSTGHGYEYTVRDCKKHGVTVTTFREF